MSAERNNERRNVFTIPKGTIMATYVVGNTNHVRQIGYHNMFVWVRLNTI